MKFLNKIDGAHQIQVDALHQFVTQVEKTKIGLIDEKADKTQLLTNVPSGAKFTDTTYTAGQGLSLSSTTFSVAAGNGLSQEVSGLALGTPSTITNLTTNSTTVTSHTHELVLPAFTWGNLKGI